MNLDIKKGNSLCCNIAFKVHLLPNYKKLKDILLKFFLELVDKCGVSKNFLPLRVPKNI